MNAVLVVILLFFLLAATQGFVISGVLFFNKRGIPNRILAIFILLFSISLLDWVDYWTEFYKKMPIFYTISDFFPTLYGPILWFYYRYSFDNYVFRKKDFWHFALPFLFFLKFIPAFLYNWFGIKNGLHFLWQMTIFNKIDLFPYVLLLSLFGYGVFIWSQYFPKFRWQKHQIYWHKWLLFFYFAFCFNYTAFTIWNNMTGKVPIYYDFFISFGIVFFIYMITILGYIRPEVFAGTSILEAIRQIKYQKSGLDEDIRKRIIEQLNQLMLEHRIYRDSELRLESIALKIGASKHYISQAINEHLKTNFSDYVNEFRIKEAQELLKNTSKKEMNVIEIAYEVGFNNKNTFNYSFKKKTGLTPTEYRGIDANKKNKYEKR